MSSLPLFLHFGCFVMENFLDSEECHEMHTECVDSKSVSAEIFRDDNTAVTDNNYRKTKNVMVSNETQSNLYHKLLSIKSQIENHFDVVLTDCEKPSFLAYEEGDFFKLHKDASDKPEAQSNNRKVSVVMFLNDQTEQLHENSYCGGSLNLYGLSEQPNWKDKGFPLNGKAGLLFAFRSNLLHEVTPVLGGQRFTVVSWFH